MAANRYDIADIARDEEHSLAQLSGESAFLSARRGSQSVCLIREEGSFPIRSFVLYEGVRFPLGIASAGLEILAFLEDSEIDHHLESNRLEDQWGPQHSASAIRDRICQTRETGYCLNPGLILEGSWGMAAAVFDIDRRPVWALSFTGIESRFRPDRQPELGQLLLEHAHALSTKIQEQRPRR